jgi:microcin-processing metallopeptidase PmbA/TldD-like protein
VRITRLSAVLLVGLGLTVPCERVSAQNDVLRRAMQDELTRSMQALRLDTMPKPYFIAYRVEEVDILSVAASRGSLLHSVPSRRRTLTVEVRVGDYALDNTNFFSMPTEGGGSSLYRGFGGYAELPLEDDYIALRRQLWLATDDAYKGAIQQYSRKRASYAGTPHATDVPDFSREDVTMTTDSVPGAPAQAAEAASLVQRLSTLVSSLPQIEHSEVAVELLTERAHYLNSEGTWFARSLPSVVLSIRATTRAADGMPLDDSFSARAASLSSLPSLDSLAPRIRELASYLARQQQAVKAEVYHGPVLVTGRAAAEVFGAVMGSGLIAARVPVSDNPAFAELMDRQQDPFLDEIGARVLPSFLSVIDNPTLQTYAGHFVGGFRVDDDGVRTRETRVVDHGILKTLLSSRAPVRGVPRSSGNRHGDQPVVSTMVVTADSGLTESALKQRLLTQVTSRGLPYGILVRRLGGTDFSSLDGPFAVLAVMANAQGGGEGTFMAGDAVRVYPDGHEEPIRGAVISDITTASFRDVVAASRAQTVYTEDAGEGELPFELSELIYARGSMYASTYVVPDLLFEDLSVKGPTGEMPPLPVVAPPWASGAH